MRSSVKELDLKLVFLGPSSVGKTSLITRYAQGTFKAGVQATVGAGFLSHVLEKNPLNREKEVDSTRITLLLWDTAGEERFKSVAPCLLHGAEGLIIVFSLTEKESFASIDSYYEMFINTVQTDDDGNFPIILLGNKCDLCDEDESQRQVEKHEIKQWMEKHNVTMYAEVSAKTGKGIKDAIENELVYSILQKYKSSASETKMMISIPTENKNEKKGCC